MATKYLSANNIKVYPAVNSPNDGDINTEYNAKTLAKSSSSRNFILSGFNFIPSLYSDTFSLGDESLDNSIKGSLIIDGYYVEIYENITFNYVPSSDHAIVFAVPHYASNTNTDRVKWEKSQHLTGIEEGDFQGIRFECLSMKYVNNNHSDYDYDPTHYYYTDEPGNTLPSNSLMVGIVYYNNHTYSEGYIYSLASWQYSKLNAEDVALSPLGHSEHRYSSLVELKTGPTSYTYPHTLAEYLRHIDDVYIRRYGDDSKFNKLFFNSDEFINNYSYIENDGDRLNIDVSKTSHNLVNVVGDLTADRVFNAVYNDYAELYEKDDIDENISPGDVIELNAETGKYRKCINAKSRLVVGICSDSYGHLIGGDKDKTLEENLQCYIPIGISGRVYANTDDETCEPGDLVMSTNTGKVATYKNVVTKINGVLDDSTAGRVLGKCLSKTENGKVLIQIMLG